MNSGLSLSSVHIRAGIFLLAHLRGTVAHVMEQLSAHSAHSGLRPRLAAAAPRSLPNHINLEALAPPSGSHFQGKSKQLGRGAISTKKKERGRGFARGIYKVFQPEFSRSNNVDDVKLSGECALGFSLKL